MALKAYSVAKGTYMVLTKIRSRFKSGSHLSQARKYLVELQAAYDSLADKRRNPGPKLRKKIKEIQEAIATKQPKATIISLLDDGINLAQELDEIGE